MLLADTDNAIRLSSLTRQRLPMAEITIRISDRTLKIAGLVLGAALLAWALSYLWTSGAFRPKYRIHLFLPQTEGVYVGAPVTLAGMKIGTVEKIDFARNSGDPTRQIDVVLRIQKRFQSMIREDSTAFLVTEGLLGGRYVDIHRGLTGAPVQPGGEIRAVPMKELGFSDFLNMINAIGKVASRQNKEKTSEDHKTPANAEAPGSR